MIRAALASCLLALLALPALAGPLDPPVGPIAPTQKPLAEIEPRTAVNSTNTPGDTDSLFRITQPGSYYLTANITGVSGKSGIEIATSGVTLDLNGFSLIGVPGSLDGINATLGTPERSIIRNGTVTAWGRDGVTTGASAHVESIVSIRNADDGFFIGGGSVVVGCVANHNVGAGLRSTACCLVVANSHFGFNTGPGITAASSTTITACTITDNDGGGVIVTNACTIRDSSITFNGLNGISASTANVIADNTLHSNGVNTDGANILITNTDNRIEDNNCTGADRGVDVNAAGNFIIRNTCSGNTVNWDIVVGNAVAPIVQASINAAAISGSTFTGNLGSTDPNANFSY